MQVMFLYDTRKRIRVFIVSVGQSHLKTKKQGKNIENKKSKTKNKINYLKTHSHIWNNLATNTLLEQCIWDIFVGLFFCKFIKKKSNFSSQRPPAKLPLSNWQLNSFADLLCHIVVCVLTVNQVKSKVPCLRWHNCWLTCNPAFTLANNKVTLFTFCKSVWHRISVSVKAESWQQAGSTVA